MIVFKKYFLFLMVVILDLVLYRMDTNKGITAVQTGFDYLVEMLLFIPPIMILVGLLDVWVPRHIVEKNVGKGSGVKGIFISILVGSAAAGPLYAGFPVVDAMLKKGCRLSNGVIFLCTWATIKIPMIMMEIRFVGWKFALARLFLTLPTIIATGYMVEKCSVGR
ncbi:permease [Desulforamulus aquiferis]|uniref:Permease n=1 Tax=Desulforamulus aquiferis TaxID=1397668 RepID=A0AAW7ZI13_9FIRM|nr:permease [Desulforamulus aquiferis]MDO7788616.1 permease [Desulforamulus aquiferis]